MRNDGKAFTKAGSFVSAIRFAHFVFDMGVCDDVFTSSRISGVVFHRILQKLKAVQRDPLTVLQVRSLEDLMTSPDICHVDKVVIGFFLLGVFARRRSAC